jgi:hypothetical protein
MNAKGRRGGNERRDAETRRKAKRENNFRENCLGRFARILTFSSLRLGVSAFIPRLILAFPLDVPGVLAFINDSV